MTEVTGPGYRLILGDCLDVLPGLKDSSVDCVVTDPPYAEIDRAYGRLTESQWWELMMGVCTQVRRVLKPTGSAVFIIQPNSRIVGSMRGWVFEFMAWVCREWNMVQDAYWWNVTSVPTVHTHRTNGLMRPSVKPCVWAGQSDCYRNQDGVLWEQADSSKVMRQQGRALHKFPSGWTVRYERIAETTAERGGSTPFNLIPLSVIASDSSAAFGHGAGTPLKLAAWWTRYICPSGGVLLDPFFGAGTIGLAAIAHGAHYIGIESNSDYYAIAARRLADAAAQPMLIPSVESEPVPVQAGLHMEVR